LAEYATNWNALGVAAPTDFGLTAAQMTLYTTLYTAWMSAYNAAKADGARSKALVQAKDDAKAELLAYNRELYQFVQASTTVTNENKVLIGVTVRKTEPTPVPPPALSPLVSVLTVTGRTVRYSLRDRAIEGSRRKPANAEGALILSYVGENPPASSSSDWKIEGQTGKNIFLIQFPDDVAPGTKCWAVALWYNRRGEYSPACDPISTYLAIGPAQQAA
jgi:hypothetical protein